jgi:hypothetical protein
MLTSGLVVASMVLPATVASASLAKAKPKVSTNFPCLSASKLNSLSGGSYGAATKAPGFANGAGTCTYLSSTSGSTFVIGHAPFTKSKLIDVANNDSAHKDKMTIVKGVGQKALYGTGKFDIFFVLKGKEVWDFVDSTNKAKLKEFKAVAGAVVPK